MNILNTGSVLACCSVLAGMREAPDSIPGQPVFENDGGEGPNCDVPIARSDGSTLVSANVGLATSSTVSGEFAGEILSACPGAARAGNSFENNFKRWIVGKGYAVGTTAYRNMLGSERSREAFREGG